MRPVETFPSISNESSIILSRPERNLPSHFLRVALFLDEDDRRRWRGESRKLLDIGCGVLKNNTGAFRRQCIGDSRKAELAAATREYNQTIRILENPA